MDDTRYKEIVDAEIEGHGVPQLGKLLRELSQENADLKRQLAAAQERIRVLEDIVTAALQAAQRGE